MGITIGPPGRSSRSRLAVCSSPRSAAEAAGEPDKSTPRQARPAPILLVGLNGRDHPSVEQLFEVNGQTTFATHCPTTALRYYEDAARPPLCLVDLETDLDWTALLPRLNSRPGSKVIGIAAGNQAEDWSRVGDLLSEVLRRPVHGEELLSRARAYLSSAAPAGPLLSSASPAMQAAIERLRRAAPSEATVLLRGETGSGKDVLARATHGWSRRKTGPFFSLNCGSLSDSLLETELFGHEKGAFTGAIRRKRGLVELAAGGTLFLDEVGELSTAMQVKILRVLQEREFMRVGGEEVLRCDVRIIAATHRDLEAMMAAGALRADLYYRLQVFPVFVPALRERPEDLPDLARHLVGRLAAHDGRPAPRLSAEAASDLVAYRWPGNVRELENVLERSMLLSGSDEIEHLDLACGHATICAAALSLTENRLAGEREYLVQLLSRYGGNVKAVASAAHLDRRTLYRHLAALHIAPSEYRARVTRPPAEEQDHAAKSEPIASRIVVGVPR